MIKKVLSRQAVLSWGAVFFLIIVWYGIFQQKNGLIETNMTAYQQTELEIVRTVAHNIDLYILHQTELHDRMDIDEFEEDIPQIAVFLFFIFRYLPTSAQIPSGG